VTIDYVYYPLKHLTEANYSNGDYYHYTYDAVGNRKTQTTKIGALISTITYNYDHANRIIDVDACHVITNPLGEGLRSHSDRDRRSSAFIPTM